MYLEDVSNDALKNIARGCVRRAYEVAGRKLDPRTVYEATKFCYLQLLKIQNADLELGAIGAEPDPQTPEL